MLGWYFMRSIYKLWIYKIGFKEEMCVCVIGWEVGRTAWWWNFPRKGLKIPPTLRKPKVCVCVCVYVTWPCSPAECLSSAGWTCIVMPNNSEINELKLSGLVTPLWLVRVCVCAYVFHSTWVFIKMYYFLCFEGDWKLRKKNTAPAFCDIVIRLNTIFNTSENVTQMKHLWWGHDKYKTA